MTARKKKMSMELVSINYNTLIIKILTFDKILFLQAHYKLRGYPGYRKREAIAHLNSKYRESEGKIFMDFYIKNIGRTANTSGAILVTEWLCGLSFFCHEIARRCHKRFQSGQYIHTKGNLQPNQFGHLECHVCKDGFGIPVGGDIPGRFFKFTEKVKYILFLDKGSKF